MISGLMAILIIALVNMVAKGIIVFLGGSHELRRAIG
jgi:hypothetical protein